MQHLYYAHSTYRPRPITSAVIDPDPDHEREDIAIQIFAGRANARLRRQLPPTTRI